MRPGSRLAKYFQSLVLVSEILFFLEGDLYSQSILKGSVKDREGEALPYATVSIKATKAMAITDSVGHFSIRASSGDLLEVTYVGYRDYQVVLGTENELHIVLSETITNLDELIIVGYGTAKRKDITGAVTRVMPNAFNTGVITNPLQQLQGKVAGMVIVQPGGDPNGDFIVRIRGASSLEGQPPLLVIDGVAIDDFHKAAATLNPADIESYDILKDASAGAIYGSRGANGVILVTTKKGNTGRTSLDYNGFVGLERVSNQLNVLSADQWRNATAAIGGGGLDKGGNTDWQKAIAQSGISQSHTIGISGGSDAINFRGSLGYITQEGVILSTGKNVINARLTANQKGLNERLEVRYGINASVINRNFLPDQSTTSQVRLRGSDFFNGVLDFLPVLPAYNPDGTFYQPANVNTINPLYPLTGVYSHFRENYFQGSVKTDYEIFKGFKAGVLGAFSRGNDIYDKFSPVFPGISGKSAAVKSNNNKEVFSGDIHGNYHKSFGNHHLDLTGVYEYNRFVNDAFGVTARGFLVPKLLNNDLSSATDVQTSDIFSAKNEVRLISLLGRAIYTFNNRYILTASFRRDGSSKFGPNHRWGNFPSVAIAWRASNEDFLKDLRWLDNLKLRLSYGFTGNQENLGPYASRLLYGRSGSYLYDGQFLQSYTVMQENNPDLKWEVRKSFNFGVDFSILKDRVSGTIDLFDDKTSDLLFLYDLPQPPFLTNQVSANAATAINRGIEITLGIGLLKNQRFNWEVLTNFATLKNNITNLSGKFKGTNLSITNRHYGYAEGGGLSGAYITQLQVGYPAGVFWIPVHAGLDTGGHELFNNYNPEGKLAGTSTSYSDQDRVFIDPTPDFTWGITNNLTYGDFDLSFFLRGVQGQKIFANALMNLEAAVNLPSINVGEKALTNGFADQPRPSTYWVRDGSYARLENITLGYNFKNWKSVKNLRVYLSASNLFILTRYDGIDPEIKTEGSQRYIDRNYFPKTRGFSLAIRAGF
ncbi:MAG TPA: SusC/RagA family TonB-linked outer membrane protein [Saprospiraceae bacterium]|nr:SusC/RagA family TonB-linked outer membrane protein [Saprospiraceae bacterium]HNT19145.1 SusC/RagA family TonB-linked outer membrane protein [Saprospiraceae bacterium]